MQTEAGECGRNLSLGQRQLVCFARALLADPKILILDEATSAIDVFTEVRIQQALAELVKGRRTSFVVVHRLSTIRGADLVLVLDQGRIIQRGRPSQVLGPFGLWGPAAADRCRRRHDRGRARRGGAVSGAVRQPAMRNDRHVPAAGQLLMPTVRRVRGRWFANCRRSRSGGTWAAR